MLRRTLIAALPAALLAGAAHAAEKKDKEKGKDEKEGVGQYVDLSAVALPITSPSGELVNYVFATVRLVLTPTANAMAWRAKEPYLRDALVRAAHKTPFTGKSYTTIDEPRLKAVLIREAGAIGAPKDIKGVTILMQAPKRTTNLPAMSALSSGGAVTP